MYGVLKHLEVQRKILYFFLSIFSVCPKPYLSFAQKTYEKIVHHTMYLFLNLSVQHSYSNSRCKVNAMYGVHKQLKVQRKILYFFSVFFFFLHLLS